MKRLVFVAFNVLLIAFWTGGCVPAEEESFAEAVVDLSDETTLYIKNLQDRQVLDSLATFLKHENPSYRLASAEAFASFRDSNILPDLIPLLDDEYPEIREAVAYTLGQIGSQRAERPLIQAFRQHDSTENSKRLNSRILEAVGKVGTLNTLQLLSTVSTYGKEDAELTLGQTRGIYRFALRGITAPEGTERMVQYVSNSDFPRPVRLMAANYLMRARGINLDKLSEPLLKTFRGDDDPEIRMALAMALGKSNDSRVLTSLLNQLKSEKDYRVQCNILRSFNNFEYSKVKEAVYPLIESTNPHVASRAAAYFVQNGNREDALRYRSISKQNLPWPVKSQMYEASNEHLPNYYTITKTNINNEIEAFFRSAKDPYEKAAYLKALARDIRNYRTIGSFGLSASHPVVQTTAIELIGGISADPSFDQVFKGAAKTKAISDLESQLFEAIKSDDVAQMSSAAYALTDSDSKLGKLASSRTDIVRQSLEKLTLPRDIETYNALFALSNKIEGNAGVTSKTVQFNHPIKWELVTSLRDSTEAEIITSKGLIKVSLFTKHAPGTVANFVQLSRDQYYNGKNFHRVVPNFVIQGGCSRGDGYGGLDYTIRSELSPAYYDGAGYLGMASAGNHTECTQWFITHSPTPHLDGNYTIFGKVKEGMDVVHSIQVGDLIREINILN